MNRDVRKNADYATNWVSMMNVLATVWNDSKIGQVSSALLQQKYVSIESDLQKE